MSFVFANNEEVGKSGIERGDCGILEAKTRGFQEEF